MRQSKLPSTSCSRVAWTSIGEAPVADGRLTKRTPRLESEWSAPGTPVMLAARRAATPPQLQERGLVLDKSSLWRDRASVEL